MAAKIKANNKKVENFSCERKNSNNKTLSSERVAKIVKNYTKRYCKRVIKPKANMSKVIEYCSLDELSEICYERSLTDESVLNSVRSSPPKAEISINSNKSFLQEEIVNVKKLLSFERTKNQSLEQAYKELLDKYTQNEIFYKNTIKELQSKIETLECPEFVLRAEFLPFAEKVYNLEKIVFNKLN